MPINTLIPQLPDQPPIVNGFKGCIQQPGGFGRNESGLYQRWIYDGTTEEINSLALYFNAMNVNFTVEARFGGKARLEAQFAAVQGTSEIPVDTWEMVSVPFEKDLLEADFPNVPGLVIRKAQKEIIERALANNEAWQASRDALQNETGDLYDDLNADEYSIYLLMKAGVRAFPEEGTTIRHTQTVSNLYTVKVSQINIGRLFSTATLIATEGVPEAILFDVPTTPTPSQFIETAGDLKYAWRKARPNILKSAQQKWQITQDWTLGLWAVKIHGSVL